MPFSCGARSPPRERRRHPGRPRRLPRSRAASHQPSATAIPESPNCSPGRFNVTPSRERTSRAIFRRDPRQHPPGNRPPMTTLGPVQEAPPDHQVVPARSWGGSRARPRSRRSHANDCQVVEAGLARRTGTRTEQGPKGDDARDPPDARLAAFRGSMRGARWSAARVLVAGMVVVVVAVDGPGPGWSGNEW